MKQKVIIYLVLISLVLIVSGCVQQTGIQPAKNRELKENEMQFVSLIWNENLNWSYLCQECQKDSSKCQSAEIDGKLHFSIFEGAESVDLSCKYALNGKTYTEDKNQYLRIAKDNSPNGDFSLRQFDNFYFNKDNELTFCCGISQYGDFNQENVSAYQVCKTRTLDAICKI